MEESIDLGPERQRSLSTASRTGADTGTQSIRKGLEGEGKRTRLLMTPNQKGAYKLLQELKKFTDIFPEEATRLSLQQEFTAMPEIRMVNASILALTLSFLAQNKRLRQDSFKDSIILPLLGRVVDLDKIRGNRPAINAYKANILRYIRLIQNFRDRRN